MLLLVLLLQLVGDADACTCVNIAAYSTPDGTQVYPPNGRLIVWAGNSQPDDVPLRIVLRDRDGAVVPTTQVTLSPTADSPVVELLPASPLQPHTRYRLDITYGYRQETRTVSFRTAARADLEAPTWSPRYNSVRYLPTSLDQGSCSTTLAQLDIELTTPPPKDVVAVDVWIGAADEVAVSQPPVTSIPVSYIFEGRLVIWGVCMPQFITVPHEGTTMTLRARDAAGNDGPAVQVEVRDSTP